MLTLTHEKLRKSQKMNQTKNYFHFCLVIILLIIAWRFWWF